MYFGAPNCYVILSTLGCIVVIAQHATLDVTGIIKLRQC